MSTRFKFYYVILNGSSYILGIHYLSSNSVRKVRLNTSGNIIEDVTDTVLNDGTIKRVSGNNVIILCGDKVVKVYKDYKLSPIKLSKLQENQFSHENPNIGVIDF